jgi:hypothetical protein
MEESIIESDSTLKALVLGKKDYIDKENIWSFHRDENEGKQNS